MAFFGHSLGARVAYEVARRFEHGARCSALFVSASEPPWVNEGTQYHRLSDDALWAAIARLGGTAQAVQSDAELRSIALPALRADYRASETYRWARGPRLTQPVVALVGDDDPDVSIAETLAWREVTDGPFARHVYPGGHFYVERERTAVLHAIVTHLRHTAATSTHARELWPSTP
jgi:surfactin synthase thioesterase subunit